MVAQTALAGAARLQRPNFDCAAVPAPRDNAQASRLALELFVAGYEGTHLPQRYAARLRDGLAGVILFARNFQRDENGAINVDALAAQTSAIHGASAHADHSDRAALPTICAVDQEGGLVARLRAPFTHFPAMATVAATDDAGLCADVGEQIGRECLAAGFNVDFAPVLDIDTNPANPIIGSRAFGRDADAVIRLAGAFLRGLEGAGVRGCGKHFPGHGDTDTDSHLALPCLDFDAERLASVELRPFHALAGELSMLMTAHILFPRLDARLPATLSPTVLDTLLRSHCRYDGLVVSDDLEMKGVAGAFSMTACVNLGLDAGVDLFLICKEESLLEEAVEAAARRLRQDGPDSAVARKAIARNRRLRTTLRRPTPTAKGIYDAIDHEIGRRLRIRFGLGTV